MSQKIIYTLNHVFSNDLNHFVGLLKKRGPKFLHNKITVPGGKVESNENLFLAASREMFEETGVLVEPSSWKLFDIYETEEYTLNKLVALTDNVYDAKSLEEEPVYIMATVRQIEYAQKNADAYTPDFLDNISKAKNFISQM